MCRHLAWSGEPTALSRWVLESEHSLLRQSYAPRHQRHGTVNADGFGVGWYVAERPEPVRYRRAQPIWGDASFASLAPTVRSGCLLAAVRDATPGFASTDETGAAPFTHGPWLFSHNGALADWPRAQKALLDRVLDVPEALAPVDSALLFGVAVSHWRAGATLGEGLACTVADGVATGGGRLSLLASDGRSVAATSYGEPVWWAVLPDGVLVASEPLDDALTWQCAPEASLLTARGREVDIAPLPL